MVTLHDAPPEELVEALGERLAERIDEPEWATFAKAGVDRDLPPEQADFWYRRAGSVLRRVAVDGPVGVERLTTHYGGKKRGTNRYGVAPEHRVDGSGKLLRTILQQLEDEGLIERPPDDEGRVVSPEGQSFLDETAGEVIEELDREDLERYV